jgi:DNA replication protein
MAQEVPVRMTNFAHILNELNNSFSGRNEVVDRLARYPRLIKDDFGKERSTEKALEHIYNMVDSRDRSRKPLIVTTNRTLDEIRHPQDTAHARIYDRLLEYVRSHLLYWCQLTERIRTRKAGTAE